LVDVDTYNARVTGSELLGMCVTNWEAFETQFVLSSVGLVNKLHFPKD